MVQLTTRSNLDFDVNKYCFKNQQLKNEVISSIPKLQLPSTYNKKLLTSGMDEIINDIKKNEQSSKPSIDKIKLCPEFTKDHNCTRIEYDKSPMILRM